MYEVEIVKPAQKDMREVGLYIAVDLQNPEAALKRLDLIDEKIQSLKEMPARFALVQDKFLAAKGYRLVVAKAHLVFFIISEDTKTVYIMRVLYSRMNWARILRTDVEQSGFPFLKPE